MSPPQGQASRVAPVIPRGMQDFEPARARARQELVAVASRVYERYGFQPLATSAIEHWEVLVGSAGPEAHQQIFAVASPEQDELGLRFDLTVPLSRYVAANQQQLPRPFRRYQVAPVWRLDKPGPGRFREFLQCDADIVGTTSAVADAEVVAALRDVFAELLPADASGPRFRVRMSDRRLLDALLRLARLDPSVGPAVLRVVDKLDRVGLAKVEAELTGGYEDESGDTIEGLGLDRESVAVVLDFLALRDQRGRTRDAVLEDVGRFLSGAEGGAEACAMVAAFSGHLASLGVTDAEACIDVSIARGLAYYTGPVFEVELRGAEAMGSVGSGGRYDDLVGRFSAQAWPGVGVSLGVDRLLAALEQVGNSESTVPVGPSVLVTVLDRERLPEYFALARELRVAGVSTDLWCGTARSFAKQVRHGDRLGVRVAVIAGGDELSRDTVTLKDMGPPEAGAESREEWLAARHGQREIPRGSLVAEIRRMLESP